MTSLPSKQETVKENQPSNPCSAFSQNFLAEGKSGAALGTIAKIASFFDDEAEKQPKKLSVFMLQNLASKLLPDEKISQCLRHRAPVNYEKDSPTWHTVEVHKNQQGRTHYEHLKICDRIWGCAVCSSRISEFRRKVITTAIDRTELQSILMTLTLAHRKKDRLEMLLDAVTSSVRRLKSGRWWQDFKKKYAHVGDIKALEVTYGENGWHPHIHILMLFEHELDNKSIGEMTRELKKRWLHVLAKQEMTADWEHGCDVRAGDQDIRDYISKFGYSPQTEQGRRSGWTVEHELTKGHTKQSRAAGRTPWTLLADYGNGDKEAGELFQEYYYAFKGRHQLQWSRGLKALLNIDEIEAEIEDESKNDEDQMIMEIYPHEWLKICHNCARGEVLQLASEKPVCEVWEYIWDLPPVPE